MAFARHNDRAYLLQSMAAEAVRSHAELSPESWRAANACGADDPSSQSTLRP